MNWFRYRHTHCFFVEGSSGLLAIDTGWPCSLVEYQRSLKDGGGRIQNVRAAVVTHFHLDHAGLVGEFQRLGIEVLVFENQLDAIDAMELTIAKGSDDRGYRRIERARLVEVAVADSRRELERRGFEGELLATPGHSPDSVSFLGPGGEAVIGDLGPIDSLMPDDVEARASWDRLVARGARKIYPGHAPFFDLSPFPTGNPDRKKSI